MSEAEFYSLSEDAFDGLEIAIERIRFKITCFGPFVPAVDSYQSWCFRVFFQVVLCHEQAFFKVFGGVVLADVGQVSLVSRVIIPAN